MGYEPSMIETVKVKQWHVLSCATLIYWHLTIKSRQSSTKSWYPKRAPERLAIGCALPKPRCQQIITSLWPAKAKLERIGMLVIAYIILIVKLRHAAQFRFTMIRKNKMSWGGPATRVHLLGKRRIFVPVLVQYNWTVEDSYTPSWLFY